MNPTAVPTAAGFFNGIKPERNFKAGEIAGKSLKWKEFLAFITK